jgi:hypothetical protein
MKVNKQDKVSHGRRNYGSFGNSISAARLGSTWRAWYSGWFVFLNSSSITAHAHKIVLPRMSMFPFVDPKSDRMQRRVVSVIQHPHFVFGLPSLSQASWDIVLHDSRERERLEFLGDALIGASISEELFRCWPNEGPGFYTVSNWASFFCHTILIFDDTESAFCLDGQFYFRPYNAKAWFS